MVGPGTVLDSAATRADRVPSADSVEARLILFREAEMGSRAAGRRGETPAKRDCREACCDECRNSRVGAKFRYPGRTRSLGAASFRFHGPNGCYE